MIERWRWKSSIQPGGSEGLAKRKDVVARRGLKRGAKPRSAGNDRPPRFPAHHYPSEKLGIGLVNGAQNPALKGLIGHHVDRNAVPSQRLVHPHTALIIVPG